MTFAVKLCGSNWRHPRVVSKTRLRHEGGGRDHVPAVVRRQM